MGSIHWQMKELRQNWDKEKFRNLHHEDFLFIRETELLHRDDHVENIDRLVTEGKFDLSKSPTLVHENEYISEARWQDGNERVTRVFMIKEGKAWRQIVSRIPIEEAP